MCGIDEGGGRAGGLVAGEGGGAWRGRREHGQQCQGRLSARGQSGFCRARPLGATRSESGPGLGAAAAWAVGPAPQLRPRARHTGSHATGSGGVVSSGQGCAQSRGRRRPRQGRREQGWEDGDARRGGRAVARKAANRRTASAWRGVQEVSGPVLARSRGKAGQLNSSIAR